MSEETVSIALCTYNGAKFLPMQVDSILQQSYKNLELIIVDDNSTDHTASVLRGLADKDHRIKLFFNENNMGFNANFEKAIKLCSGNFIAIADQDDIWELNKVALLMKHIGNNWLIFSNSQFIDEEGHPIEGQILLDNFSLEGRDYRSLLLSNFVTGHTVLFSKSFLNYLFPIPKVGYYDWWMGFIALYHKKITCLNRKLTLHRIHRHSVMYREKEIDVSASRNERYTEMVDNLSIVKDYQNLKADDYSSIVSLYLMLTKNTIKNILSLTMLIFKNYSSYFPDLKTRGVFSRLNYAIKFAKRNY